MERVPSTVSRAFCTIRFVPFHGLCFIAFHPPQSDRNAIVTYLTAIVCNCHIVTDGIRRNKKDGACRFNHNP